MADDIAITPGAGANVATDEISGGRHVQLVKLMDGTANGTDVISGNATQGLLVTSANISNVGNVANANVSIAAWPSTLANLTNVANANVSVAAWPETLANVTNVANANVAVASWPATLANLTNVANCVISSMPGAQPANAAALVSGTNSATTTGNTAVIAAQGAGNITHISGIIVHNSNSLDTFVKLYDGATLRAIIPAPGKGGAAFSFPHPLRGTANTAWNFASNDAVSTMYVTLSGYVGA